MGTGLNCNSHTADYLTSCFTESVLGCSFNLVWDFLIIFFLQEKPHFNRRKISTTTALPPALPHQREASRAARATLCCATLTQHTSARCRYTAIHQYVLLLRSKALSHICTHLHHPLSQMLCSCNGSSRCSAGAGTEPPHGAQRDGVQRDTQLARLLPLPPGCGTRALCPTARGSSPGVEISVTVGLRRPVLQDFTSHSV